MADTKTQTGETSTVIGADATFKGEIAFEGAMRIDGRFEGKLQSKGRLSIGRNAHVAADMTVGHLSVDGTFDGNAIAAERIELAASAKVTGDLRAPRLVVAEGATLVGTLHISPDAAKTPAAATGRTERTTAMPEAAPVRK